MTIDKRLRAVVNEIEGNTLVDCGCDHGKVTCEALLQKRVNKVIATDISSKSLEKCFNLAKKLKLENVECRCGDGLEVIKDNEADIVCIAGMGGYEIIKILSNAPSGIEKLVLCPHHDTVALREFLQKSYKIEKDYAIYCDEHFYNLIVATKGSDKLSDKELLLGRDSLENEDYRKQLLALREKYIKIQNMDVPKDRFDECQRCIKLIDGELNGSKKDI